MIKIKEIEPHEPEEQLVNIDAAFRDADRMMQERKRIKQEGGRGSCRASESQKVAKGVGE